MPIGPAPVTPTNDASGGQPPVGSSRVIIVSNPDGYGAPISAGLEYDRYSAASFTVLLVTASTTLEYNPPIVVRCEPAAANMTLTLPSAAATNSNIWHISKTNSNVYTVTIALNTLDTWYGDNAAKTLSTQWDSVTLVSVNDAFNNIAGWHVLATT